MADFESPIEVQIGEGVITYPFARVPFFFYYNDDINQYPRINFTVRNYRILENGTKEDAPIYTQKEYEISSGMIPIVFQALAVNDLKDAQGLLLGVRESLLKSVKYL